MPTTKNFKQSKMTWRRIINNCQAAIEHQWQQPSWIYIFIILIPFFMPFSYLNRAKKNQNNNVWLIGNLSAGASGKTPLVIAIVKWLQANNNDVVILARGYKSGNSQPGWVCNTHLTEEYGDEACMLKLVLNVPIMVAANRKQAIAIIRAQYPKAIIVCDDGAQHRQLQYSHLILFANNYRNNLLLPAGPVRTPSTWLAKFADYMIEPNNLQSQVEFFLKLSDLTIFFEQTKEQQERHKIAIDEMRSIAAKGVELITAIGNPLRVKNTLISLDITVNRWYRFPDHHNFTEQDLKPLVASANKNIKYIVTMKDALKILNSKVMNHEQIYVAVYNTTIPNDLLTKLPDWLQQSC